MGEFQYYEFQAIDRPLDREDQAALRALSTRARITAASFTNHYEWGDFKGDPRPPSAQGKVPGTPERLNGHHSLVTRVYGNGVREWILTRTRSMTSYWHCCN